MAKIKFFQKGITLIELLVGLSIFLLVISGATRVFLVNLKSQRIILAEQLLLDQANYSLEYMSRALRMAKKELNCEDPTVSTTCSADNPSYCLTSTGYGYNYEITQGGEKIRFINPMRGYACQEFYWDKNENMLKEEIIKLPSGTPIAAAPLLSERIWVESLKFEVFGNSQDDNLQPKVTINMKLEIPEENFKLNIQNTISQRDLDVEY